MTVIAEKGPSTWFDRLTMIGHPELVEGYRNLCANNYAVMYIITCGSCTIALSKNGIKIKLLFFGILLYKEKKL